MFSQKLLELNLSNFGPFVGDNTIKFPTNGLLLLKGKIEETGGGSGAGKSFILNAITHTLGYCQFPATQLQSWYSEDPPFSQVLLETQDGIFNISRKSGLVIKSDSLKNVLKGKVAETELDKIFGNLDSKTRALITYRPQKKPGLFLSMDDSKKKEFLTKILELNKYESVKTKAEETLTILNKELEKAVTECQLYDNYHNVALEAFNKNQVDFDKLDTLLYNKTTLESKLKENTAILARLTNEVSQIRCEHQQVLDIALKSIREEIIKVTNRKEPVEVEDLRSEKKKQLERLEKCKKYDSEQKLNIIQERNLLTQELASIINNLNKNIIQINSDAKIKIEQEKNKLNQELSNKINSLNSELLQAREDIKTIGLNKEKIAKLKKEETELLNNRCPTCSQQWADAKKKLEVNKISQEELQDQIRTLYFSLTKEPEICNQINSLKEEYKNKLNNIQSLVLKEQEEKIKDVESEKTFITESKQEEILALKDPEPHPAGEQVKNKIEELSNKIKELELLYKQGKESDLAISFKKEQEYKDKLILEYNERILIKNNESSLIQKNNIELLEKIKQLDLDIQQEKNNRDNYKKLEVALNNAKVELDKAIKNKELLLNKVNLESDIAYLVGYKGFLGAIFSDVLDEIADQTNDILSHVANVRHLTFNFETEKEAVTTGNINSRITPVIFSRGRKISFESGISGGMQAAVELAVDLAVSNVVSCRRGTYPGFMILDESLHGLSGVEKSNCIEMLGAACSDKLILIVDHSPEFCSMFNQVVEIIQEDGVSRVL